MIVGDVSRRHSTPLAAAAWLALSLAACSTGQGPQSAAPPPGETAAQRGRGALVASYRGGTVTLDKYQLMLRATGLHEDQERSLERARTVAVTEVLAGLALGSGADLRPACRVALRLLDARVLGEALRRHVLDGISVPDEQIATAAAALAEQLHQPRRVRLRNLFKRFPSGDDPAEVARVWADMERIRQELAAGADFSDLAARESESQTRYRGGRVGLVDPERLDPVVAAVVANLRPGETSPIIETPPGLTILRCDEVVEASTPDEGALLQRAKETLISARMREEWGRLSDRLMQDVQINLEVVRQGGGGPEPAIVFPDGDTLGVDEAVELLRQKGATGPPAEMPADTLDELLRGFALTQRVAAYARQLGLDASPELAAELEWGRLQILADEELRTRVEGRFQPYTVAEAEAFFAEEQDGFQAPEEFQLGAIVLDAPAGRLHEVYADAAALVTEIEQGRLSFEDAARKFSSHPSAGRGGDLGWLDRWQLRMLGPVVAEMVPSLEPGQVSEVVLQQSPGPTSSSLWVVRLTAVRPARPMSFERTVAEGLIVELDRQRWNTLRDQVWRELESELDVRLVDQPAR